jgi:hypothetical protein
MQRDPRFRVPVVLALALCALLLINWVSPLGFRFTERSLDAPVLFGALSLLSAFAVLRGGQIRRTWLRLLVRTAGVSILMLAIPSGCTRCVFWIDALPVAHLSIGSDRVVAYLMAGGAVGPHYTEFREERPVVPGLVLARVVGYSPYIGDVTLAVSDGNSLRAVVSEDTEGGSPHVFEYQVAPLLRW